MSHYRQASPPEPIRYMDEKVNLAVYKMATNGRDGMTEFINQYKDKRFILPICPKR